MNMYIYVSVENILWCFSVSLANNNSVNINIDQWYGNNKMGATTYEKTLARITLKRKEF